MSELIERLREILDGIDETECDSENGWWETSTGADLGARKLVEVEALFTATISRLQAELADAREVPGRIVEWLRERAAHDLAGIAACRSGNAGRTLQRFSQRRRDDATAIEARDWSKP